MYSPALNVCLHLKSSQFRNYACIFVLAVSNPLFLVIFCELAHYYGEVASA